jgi:hypothetical protein
MFREGMEENFETTLLALGGRPVGVVRPEGNVSYPNFVEVYVRPSNGHLPDLRPEAFLPRTIVSVVYDNPNGRQGWEKLVVVQLSDLETFHLEYIAERDRRAIELGYIKEFYPNISL